MRQFFGLLLLLSFMVSGLGSQDVFAAKIQGRAPKSSLNGKPEQLERKRILNVRKDGRDFEIVSNSIQDELRDKYDFEGMVIGRDTEYITFKKKVELSQPHLIILMDNKAVGFAQRLNSELKKPVPCLALMGINFASSLKGDKNIAAIAYESPGYSLVTQFRYNVDKKVQKVAVIYRDSVFRERVELAARELAREGVELQPVNVESEGTTEEEIGQVLNTKVKDILQDSGHYDAAWIILDSVILSPGLMAKNWIPQAQNARIPILVEVESLVAKEINFGTFAVTPNLADMGNQAAQMVEAILRDGISPKDIGVERVISVNRVINLLRLQNLGIKGRNLAEVQVIE